MFDRMNWYLYLSDFFVVVVSDCRQLGFLHMCCSLTFELMYSYSYSNSYSYLFGLVLLPVLIVDMNYLYL